MYAAENAVMTIMTRVSGQDAHRESGADTDHSHEQGQVETSPIVPTEASQVEGPQPVPHAEEDNDCRGPRGKDPSDPSSERIRNVPTPRPA